ncbi:MAG: sensor histidine kinase [Janthinobacterium lividum]
MLSTITNKECQRISIALAVTLLFAGLFEILSTQVFKSSIIPIAPAATIAELILTLSSLSIITLKHNLVRLTRILVMILSITTALIFFLHTLQVLLGSYQKIFAKNTGYLLLSIPLPGNSFPVTSGFSLLAIALLLLYLKRYVTSQIIALIAFLLAYAALANALLVSAGSAISILTALLLLSVAIILYQPQQGWMVVINGELFCWKIISYTFAYVICTVPLLVAFYRFVTQNVNISKGTCALSLLIATALFCSPVLILLFNRLKRLARKLKKTNEQLTLAINAASMGVWDMDIASCTIRRSEKQAELFGQPFTEIISEQLFFEQIYTEDRQLVRQAFTKALKSGTLEVQCRVILPDLRMHWLLIFGETKYDESGHPCRILGMMKNITNRKEVERHKDEFISTVSHELKTPITSIKAQTQILERKFSKSADPATAMMLQRITVQINRLNIIINDLLEAGRAESPVLPLRKEEFYFEKIVEETVAEIQRTTRTHQLIIENTNEITCIGDKERICQILSNLLTNAIKYSPGKDKVIVKVQEQHQQVCCSVQDFGLGIAPEKQGRIFERFYRVTDSYSGGMISGFGLGLYISCELVKRLGGKIGLNSSPGKGSVFYFSVPKVI